MRLLVVSQYFWPENFRINDLVAELVRRGHDVTVLTGLPNYPEGKVFQEFRDAPAQFARYMGAEVIRVPLVPRGKGSLRLVLNYLTYAVSASIIGLWKLRGQQFDAIFTCQLSPVTVGLPAALLRHVKHIPMVLWVLDLWPDTLSAIGVIKSPLLLRWVGRLVSFVYARSDLILAQSRSFIPQIQKYTDSNRRIIYFPSWAESVFNREPVAPAPEVPLQPGSFNVMFAGNIGEAQDFPAILAAASSLKLFTNIRWLIVGDGRLANWVEEEVKRLDLQSSVLMLGRHPLEKMPSFYKHADALLVSLKNEPIFSMTIPGKLQSYLATGIPVVAMLDGEGAEVLMTSRAGLVCSSGDSSGLAEAVLKLSLMTLEERVVLGKSGLAVTANDFDRDRLIGGLEDELQRMVRENYAQIN